MRSEGGLTGVRKNRLLIIFKNVGHSEDLSCAQYVRTFRHRVFNFLEVKIWPFLLANFQDLPP